MEKYGIHEVHRNRALLIVLITSLDINVGRSRAILSCYANLRPRWLVIRQKSGIDSADMESTLVPNDELYAIVPGLKGYLTS